MNITQLLTLSVKQGASDLHLSAGMPPLLRVDGDIVALEAEADVDIGTQTSKMSHEHVHGLITGLMNDTQREDYARSLEVDFAVNIPSLARFRVNAFTQQRGGAAVFRTIPNQVQDFAQLGMGSVFKGIATARQGLVLITGPTGCGKSTSLAAIIHHINSNRRGHVLTIEDPIEFVHHPQKCLINQREVHRHSHSFSAALRSALREDPDIILIGELRDLETVRLAISAAETGHLVFATLHTPSAAQTVDRIIDVFPSSEKAMVRTMLAESLHAVVCQTLLKRKGGGRVAAYEIMLGSPAVRNLIRENKVAQMHSVIQTGSAIGMQTLQQSKQALQAQGVLADNALR